MGAQTNCGRVEDNAVRTFSIGKTGVQRKMVLKPIKTEKQNFGKAIKQFLKNENGRHRDRPLRQTINNKYRCGCFVDELTFFTSLSSHFQRGETSKRTAKR